MLERDGRFQIESVRVTTDLAWEIVTSFLFHVFRFEQNYGPYANKPHRTALE